MAERSQPPAGAKCTRASKKMEGQLSLFLEEQGSSTKPGKKRKKQNMDSSQTYDERMKRYWHYMETKGMNEQWIETCEGELRIMIEALADYQDIAGRKVEAMEAGYSKAVWEDRLGRIRKIQTKLEKVTGYDRDGQLEICMKRKPRKDNDIGEDALILAMRG